jgi:hypothetical protein
MYSVILGLVSSSGIPEEKRKKRKKTHSANTGVPQLLVIKRVVVAVQSAARMRLFSAAIAESFVKFRQEITTWISLSWRRACKC